MTTEERLQRLERQCRWYRNLFVLAGLGLVAALTWGATQPIPNNIVARNFQVVNKDNNTVAALGQVDRVEGGFLALYGAEGPSAKSVVTIGVLPGGGFINVGNLESKSAVFIGGSSNTKTGGLITLKYKTGEAVVQLFADETGNGKVGVYNREGKGRILQPGPQ